MKRIAGLLGISLMAILLLAGCIDMKTDLTLGDDARATGSMEIAIDKSAASLMGVSSFEQFKQQAEDPSNTETVPGQVEGGEVSYSETDTSYVVNVKFENYELVEPDFNAKREGDTVRFVFRSSTPEGAESADSSSPFSQDLGAVKLTVNFPGKLQSVTGAEQVGDRTIKFEGSLAESFAVEAVSGVGAGPLQSLENEASTALDDAVKEIPYSDATSSDSKGFPWLLVGLLIGGLGFLVVLAGALGLFFYLRKRNNQSAAIGDSGLQEPVSASDSSSVPSWAEEENKPNF